MTTATLTLSDFLLARIAEDEESLPGGPDLSGYVEGFSDEESRRIAAEWSAWERRWAAECAAKRRIVEAHAAQWAGSRQEDSVQRNYMSKGRLNGLWTAVQLLALPYADHADYREEWRP